MHVCVCACVCVCVHVCVCTGVSCALTLRVWHRRCAQEVRKRAFNFPSALEVKKMGQDAVKWKEYKAGLLART